MQGEGRELVVHPGAVVILPCIEDRVLLIRNYRFAVKKTLWELPAGTLESGESPETCAARELIEETGYQADQIKPLLHFYTTPGFCDEILYAYEASGLTFVGQNLDEGEQIEVVPTPFAKAVEMIFSGEIVDAKTISVLLYSRYRKPL